MTNLILYVLPYLAVLIFLAGCLCRLTLWLRAPVPLKIPLTPAPTTFAGVVARYAAEILVFRTLFTGDRLLWLASWVFHATLAFIVAGHVVGIFLSGLVCKLRGWTPEQYARFSALSGGTLGIIILLPLIWLFVRRLNNERVRYISTPGDYFALLLLLAIVITGECLRFAPDIHLADVRDYLIGLATFRFAAPPNSALFVWHFLFVNALLIYAPFGKLLHAGGIFFSPPLNQLNNPRDQRHVNPWETD